jgi:TPP-dependent pyruvate/acetoin dehydrogenase alpha subunit
VTGAKLSTDLLNYRSMLMIRRTENYILRMFSEGRVNGTTHTYIGQEANAVGVFCHLDPKIDFVFTNHRNHGHYLSFGGSVEALLGEIIGRSIGVSRGKGGSQHLHVGNFYSSGILGGGVPIACGVAMAEARRKTGAIVTVCIGDGTLGQGILYEALNMASLWSLPVLFLLENNGIAQTTPVELAVAGSIVDRGRAFGIRSSEIDSSDVQEIRAWSGGLIENVRSQSKPCFGVIHTRRLAAHSKGDDTRAVGHLQEIEKRDPLLIQSGRLSRAELDEAERWVGEMLDKAVKLVEESPTVDPNIEMHL